MAQAFLPAAPRFVSAAFRSRRPKSNLDTNVETADTNERATGPSLKGYLAATTDFAGANVSLSAATAHPVAAAEIHWS